MSYELWNRRSRSSYGAFDTEGAAMQAVRRAADAYGRDFAERLVLGHENRRGRTRQIAAGAELVERALAGERRPVPA
jgi:hypothetical protein